MTTTENRHVLGGYCVDSRMPCAFLLPKNTGHTLRSRRCFHPVVHLVAICCFLLLLFSSVLTTPVRSLGSDTVVHATDRDKCAALAEGRLRAFTRDVGDACRDNQRQRKCQRVMSQVAVPKLMRDSPGGRGSCGQACPFHAVISELGGEPLNQIAVAAFLRAFIVTQPEESVLNIWCLPWDNLQLPDISAGCGGRGGGGSGGGEGEGEGGSGDEGQRTLSPKLRGDGWRRRVRVRKLDSDVLGAVNLFWMWWYQTSGNTFRLLRTVVRLSDQLRFQLLRAHGGKDVSITPARGAQLAAALLRVVATP